MGMDKTLLAIFISLIMIGVVAIGVIITSFLHYDITPGRFFITNILIGAGIISIIIFVVLAVVFLRKL